MNLSQALRLSPPIRLALVGAGGKTTAMFRLARELAPAIVAATTHLGAWQIPLADRHFVWEEDGGMPDIEPHLGSGVTLVTGPLDSTLDEAKGRTRGLSPAQLEALHDLAGRHSLPLLIEADGARQKPLKAPGEHEPVIPTFTKQVVVVAGLTGLGKPLTEEWVHRAETFGKLVNWGSGKPVTPDALARLLTHPEGGLKNIPAGARRVVLLNQADTAELQATGGKMAQDLLGAFDAVLVGALAGSNVGTSQRANLSTFERAAGIILAAGESTRFGRPKQLLDYHGQPFVRAAAQTALQAGLSPVVVVTGAGTAQVEAALAGLPVKIVRNEAWRSGQSSSIRAGLEAVSRRAGAAIFLLADQPQVTPTVLRALVEEHARTLAPVVAPLVEGRRANPVLFDRVTFQDLRRLQGDVGGRGIFSKFSPTYLPWHDSSLLLDVDRPEDYERLLAR
ncbi:MAG: putative selenium-dependent hydroxylase accessory protein YqeC [Chloroflexi bacterium]|nr:putative selenium-dependent hydroxylase accessory protein YqeC [Chloroflexota bacterium]